MTTKEVLDSYKINILNRKTSTYGIVTNDKFFLGGEQMESFFGLSYNDLETLNDILIPTVEHFLNGDNPPLDWNDTYFTGINNTAIIYVDKVCFISHQSRNVIQTVPIGHFKIIAEAWRDFLAQPPLGGTIL